MAKGVRMFVAAMVLATIPLRTEAGWEVLSDQDLAHAFEARTVAFQAWGVLDFKADGRLLYEGYWGVWRVEDDALCLAIAPLFEMESCYQVTRHRIDLRLDHTGANGAPVLVTLGRYIDLN